MRKKLSFLIALAISLSINTAAFADSVPAASADTTNSTSINIDTTKLTLQDALSNVEGSNTELKLMKDKINSLNKQYDVDHNYAVTIDTSQINTGIGTVVQTLPYITDTDTYNTLASKIGTLKNQYLQAKLVQDVVPLNDEQKIKDAKNSRDQRLNIIKFDLQRQYLNVLTCKDQIDNINKASANIDEQIEQIQQKINVGQATSTDLDSLNVQKSQLSSEIKDINDQIDASLLAIKQYLNIDLNKNLTVSTEKKTFVKFDDKDIANKINDAVKKDYSLSQIQGNIDIVKKQNELYSKYAHNSLSGETSSQSTLAQLQSTLITTNASLPQALWAAYYSLKSKENAVETQMLTEKSAQDTYDKAKNNFDVGNTDKVTLDSAALDLDKQKNLTQRAINDYMVTKDEFEYLLDGHASAKTSLSTQTMGVSGIGY